MRTAKMFFSMWHSRQSIIFWAISVVLSDGFSPAEEWSPKPGMSSGPTLHNICRNVPEDKQDL